MSCRRYPGRWEAFLALLSPTEAAARQPGRSSDVGSANLLLYLLRRVPLPSLSSAFLLQCRRHHGSTQALLPFYGRKMNCLPSSGAERDDRTESCHLLWFWQQESVLPSATLGWTVHARHSERETQKPSQTAPRCILPLPGRQRDVFIYERYQASFL